VDDTIMAGSGREGSIDVSLVASVYTFVI